ncbi:MAG: 2-hydroxyacyl-CoA dehydratase [Planctomycetota bacterium]
MNAPRVALASPFVPPEWIAAHGAHAFPMPGAEDAPAPEGRCPYAATLHAIATGPQQTLGEPVDLIVLATTCDQMRRASETTDTYPRVFCFGLPHTWGTPTAWRAYRAELERLSRRLRALGCSAPAPAVLAEHMRAAEIRRDAALGHAGPARERAAALLAARSLSASGPAAPVTGPRRSGAVPLALIGGHLRPSDRWLYDLVEDAGTRVVLDATEWGERTLPRRFDGRALREDPVGELVDAYFGYIPAAFRRPNSHLFAWLRRALNASDARACVFVRQSWCDMWHAEWPRLREWCARPAVTLAFGDHAASASARTRIEALVERIA